MTAEDKENLKHYKDCLKVLKQPQMVDLVKNIDAVIKCYQEKIDLINDKDLIALGNQREIIKSEGWIPRTDEELKKAIDNF